MGARYVTGGYAPGAVLSLGVAALIFLPTRAASAQEMAHDGGLAAGQVAAGLVNGAAQGLVLLLVGMVAFAALVWVPASRPYPRAGGAGRLFARVAWVLVGALVVVGAADLAVYAVRATGDALSLGLFGEALFETRTGWIWISRVLLGALTALAASWASRRHRSSPWLASSGVGLALLVTLAQGSHAASEPDLLPLISSWLHAVAAAFWVGGLAGLVVVLVGPLRALERPDERSKLRQEAVRRFSRVATAAVVLVVVTGLHATLLNVPDPAALVGTPYGRALVMKLGIVAMMLAAGGINLIDGGRGPLGRMVGAELVLAVGVLVAAGFLTTLPPAGYGSP